MSRVAVAVTTLFFLLAMALATGTFWPLYQDPHLVVLVAVTVPIGCAIALVGRSLRWSAPVVAIATLVAFAVLGVPLAVPSAATEGLLPSLDGERQLFQATALAWKQLLTISPPVGTYQALLVPPFLLALVGSVIGLSVVTRARLGDLGALAPLVVFVTAIAFGLDYARWPRAAGLLLLALLLAMIVSRRTFARRAAVARAIIAGGGTVDRETLVVERSRTVRSAAAAVVLVVLASAASVGATAALPPTGARDVLRSSITQPFDPRSYPSPLSGFRAYLTGRQADAVLFRMSGLPAGARVRIATLDSYDGIVFSVGGGDGSSGLFSRLPYRVDRSAEAGTAATVRVTVGSYSDVWLPTVGDLETVGFEGSRAVALGDGFYVNTVTGTAAVLPGLASGDAYTLDTIVPTAPSETEWPSLTPGPAAVPSPSVVPDGLEVALTDFTAAAQTPGARLAAMVQALRGGYLSHGGAGEPPSASGHAASRITALLTGESMVGDAEQYAVTAALMADELGFPARVVYGFRPDVVVGGTTDVTGASVSAWIEVDTAQYGWVAIDPTPTSTDVPAAQTDPDQAVSRPPTIVLPPVDAAPETEQQAPPSSAQSEATPIDAALEIVLAIARVGGWVVLALGVIAAPFAAVVTAKARRRHRRRGTPEPVERVAAGWREFEDAAVDHGFPSPSGATRTEFAGALGSSRATLLAVVADRAVFSPDEVDAADADRVWTVVDELRGVLDRGTTRWGRIRARVSLRSVGRGRLERRPLRRSGDA